MIERPVIGVLEYVLSELQPIEQRADQELTVAQAIRNVWNAVLFGVGEDESDDGINQVLGRIFAHAFGTLAVSSVSLFIGFLAGGEKPSLMVLILPAFVIVIGAASGITSAVSEGLSAIIGRELHKIAKRKRG